MYTFLKTKYLYNREQWSLIQQIVVAENFELQAPKNFRDETYQNLSIAFQIYKKKEKQTVSSKNLAAIQSKQDEDFFDDWEEDYYDDWGEEDDWGDDWGDDDWDDWRRRA